MKPTKADLETFNGFKKVLLESGFGITHDNQDEFWLHVGCRFPEASRFPYYFIVSYNLSQKFIIVLCSTRNSVSSERQADVLEVLNYRNCHLMNTRLVIPPGIPKVVLRGFMEPFTTPLSRGDFRIMLKRFVKALSFLLPMIDDFLVGKIKKEEVMGGCDEEMESEKMALESEDLPVC